MKRQAKGEKNEVALEMKNGIESWTERMQNYHFIH
jgi:hypothetical protein